jgi:hypothetical protein
MDAGRKRSRSGIPAEDTDEVAKSQAVQEFETALNRQNALEATVLYASVAEEIQSDARLTRYLMLLNGFIRQANMTTDSVTLGVVNTIRDNCMASNHVSSTNFKILINCYRDLKAWEDGNKLWDWMMQQKDGIGFFNTYAAGMEFLIRQGGEPGSQQVIESTFKRALDEVPNSFLSYHISPNAIVANRDEDTSASLPDNLDRLIEKLMQGRARDKDDFKSVFLLLDSAFRLSPNNPNPYLLNCIFDYNASLSHQYKVAVTSCQMGIPVSTGRIHHLLNVLANRDMDANFTTNYLVRRISSLNAALDLILWQYSATLTFNPYHINCLLVHLTLFLGRANTDPIALHPELLGLSRRIAHRTHQLFETIYPFLTPPALPGHNALLILARNARDPELLTSTLRTLIRRGGLPDDTTRRVLVAAAGTCGSLPVLTDAWTELVDVAAQHGRPLDHADWGTLMAAAHALHDPFAISFLKHEAARLNHPLDPSKLAALDRKAVAPLSPSEEPLADLDQAYAQFDASLSRFESVVAAIHASPTYAIDTSALTPSIGPSGVLAPVADMYAIYDSVTSDTSMPPPPPPSSSSSPPSSSSSSIPLSDLPAHPTAQKRFSAWLVVTEMMALEDRRRRAIKAMSSVAEEGEIEAGDDGGVELLNGLDEVRRYVLKLRGIDDEQQAVGV